MSQNNNLPSLYVIDETESAGAIRVKKCIASLFNLNSESESDYTKDQDHYLYHCRNWSHEQDQVLNLRNTLPTTFKLKFSQSVQNWDDALIIVWIGKLDKDGSESRNCERILTPVTGSNMKHDTNLENVKRQRQIFFIAVHDCSTDQYVRYQQQQSISPMARWNLFQHHGVNMICTSKDLQSICIALLRASLSLQTVIHGKQQQSYGQIQQNQNQKIKHTVTYTCPFCALSGFSEDELWLHSPLYHVNERQPISQQCPICNSNDPQGPLQGYPLAVHLRNAHGPCGRGQIHGEFSQQSQTPIQIHAFALLVVLDKLDQLDLTQTQILLVQEFASSGFWLPGGAVDVGEDLKQAAIRECVEEAGVEVEIKGILQVQYNVGRSSTSGNRGSSSSSSNSGRKKQSSVRLRVIFLATPISSSDSSESENQSVNLPSPKSIPDYESCGACWVKVSDLINESYTDQNRDHNATKIPLRGPEPTTWLKYLFIEKGHIAPPSLLSEREM